VIYRYAWLIGLVLVAGCARTATAGTPLVAPTSAPILGCDLTQMYLTQYRWIASSPKVWEQLVQLQGGMADGGMDVMTAELDGEGRCYARWTGTLNGQRGPRATLTWWYVPATGEVQAADAATKQALGW
jgi:hypothetical protein